MDKNIIKIIGLIVGLIVLVAAIVFVLIQGVGTGPIRAISVQEIGEKSNLVDQAKLNIEQAETKYNSDRKRLENAKKEFTTEKEAYELISDEKIAAVKEATKQEEYLIEYLWITLGNYASAHKLDLAIIEPGGSVKGQSNVEDISRDETTVSTGTGIEGDSTGVTSENNAAATGSPTSGTTTEKDENKEDAEPEVSVTEGLKSDSNSLTVQVKGTYMDLADFVFEVENDKSLRFRLDNISMKSAGGVNVIASFNVKDFTVLKYLE